LRFGAASKASGSLKTKFSSFYFRQSGYTGQQR